MKLKVIASPELTKKELDFDFEDLQKNIPKTKKLLSQAQEDLSSFYEFEGFKLVKVGDWSSQAQILLYRESDFQTVYFVNIKVKSFKILGSQAATQIEVWRKSGTPATEGFPKKIFFELLLPRYKLIISDEEQTSKGKIFWEDAMARAVTLGHKVGYVSIKLGKVDWFDQGSFLDWIRDHQKAWGVGKKYRDRRFIVSE